MACRELKSAKPITPEDQRKLRDQVAAILERVRSEGDAGLRHFMKLYDQYEPDTFLVPKEEKIKARGWLPPDIRRGLDYAIERVTAFAEAQRKSLAEFESEMIPGLHMGQRLVPIESCGCYIPAGRYPCLTSAVMSVVPAKVAGVKRIVCCSPPGRNKEFTLGILYTLDAMGIDEIYCMGGAQAIAALAYGTKTIKPVDLIVGPGNQWVTEAKRQVFGTVGIDFLAGPSECLIIADDSARPDYIAADLLAQCEHDPNARGALVTTSEPLAIETLREIERQLTTLSTEKTARESWENNGIVAVANTIKEAVQWTNAYAPEHLEVHTRNPRQLLPLLTSYGSLFLGELAAEVFADKVAGTNHILPTGRAARYTGGLWVGTFLKAITHQEVTARDTAATLGRYSQTQAEYEGMDAHRNAAAIRLRDLQQK
jgi:sulfopropanediol 3-dehydrogenase